METVRIAFLVILLWVHAFSGLAYHTQTEYKTVCNVKLNDCEYEVSVLPSNGCTGQGHTKQSRSKRNSGSGQYEISEISKQVESMSNKLDRMEQKLTREMRDLSKRVLRGARKLEATVLDRSSKGSQRSRLCPEGFVTVDGCSSCYMLSRFNTSWFEAIDFCTALDSNLVALEQSKEHFLVTFLIRNSPGKYENYFYHYKLYSDSSIFFDG